MTIFWLGFQFGMGFGCARLFYKFTEELINWYYDRKGKPKGN